MVTPFCQNGNTQGIAAGVLIFMRKKVNWVLDADIRDFFGSLKHEWLIKFVQHALLIDGSSG